jgi:hypothetical protein
MSELEDIFMQPLKNELPEIGQQIKDELIIT